MQSLPPTKPTPRPRAEALVVSLTTDLPGKGGACYQMLTRYSAGLRDALLHPCLSDGVCDAMLT
jgi:hypothetical protein